MTKLNDNLVLGLDFDGVLFDTRYEKLFSGFNTYLALNPKSQLFGGKELTFNNYNERINKYQSTVNDFNNMLDFIGIAGENACVFELIEEKIRLCQYSDFRIFINEINRDKYNDYHQMILNLRDNYSHHTKDQYIKLVQPFEDVINTIRNIGSKMEVVICTMKPRENVVFINNVFNLAEIFSDIITVSGSQKKLNVLENYADNMNIKHKDVYFIDDHPYHLKRMSSSKIHCYLAEWGYHVEENEFNIEIDPRYKISIGKFKILINSLISGSISI